MSDIPTELKIGTVHDKWMENKISSLEADLAEKETKLKQAAQSVQNWSEWSVRQSQEKDELKAQLSQAMSALSSARIEGYKEGLRAFAWWKDGVQYVGTCGTTLEEALKEAGNA